MEYKENMTIQEQINYNEGMAEENQNAALKAYFDGDYPFMRTCLNRMYAYKDNVRRIKEREAE